LRKFRIVIYLCFSTLWVLAQRVDRHGDNWLFGSKASLYFPFGGDPGISNLNKITTENTFMTYSDVEGKLVLYSNGTTVWNASNNVIEGAANLVQSPSPNYPGLIVPIPESDGLFYVFSIDDSKGNANANSVEFPIFYSKIDMALNAGSGKKVGLTLLLRNETSFGMTTVKHCNNVDYWLVIHKGTGNGFLSYLITTNGIDTDQAIESKVGIPFIGSSLGLQQEIIISEDGKKLAVTKPANPEGGFIELFDFDNVTGKITRSITTYKNLGKIKGAALSPDGKFIYVSIFENQQPISATEFRNDFKVVQYRTTFAPAYEKVILTKSFTGQKSGGLGEFLLDVGSFGNLKLGPNGKIYLAHLDATALSIILDPNNAGLACDLDYQGLSLNGKKGSNQFSSTVSPDYPEIEASIAFNADSLACNPTLSVKLKGLQEANAKFQWFLNGNEISGANKIDLKITEAGDYMVKVSDDCREAKSLIKAITASSDIESPISDIKIKYCQGEEIRSLTAQGTNIKWYSDANLATLLKSEVNFLPPLNSNVVAKKMYYVTQTVNNCESPPTQIEIEIAEASKLNIGESVRTECFGPGQEIEISLLENTNEPVEWFLNGLFLSNQKSIKATNYGTYIIQKVDSYCPSSDTLTLEEGCLRFYIPTAFSPNGDGKNETLVLNGNGNFEFTFELVDRRGRIMTAIKNNTFNGQALTLWDGLYFGSPAPIGSYPYTFETKVIEEGKETIDKKRGSILLLR
jgi:gliding motility-associated-like protein